MLTLLINQALVSKTFYLENIGATLLVGGEGAHDPYYRPPLAPHLSGITKTSLKKMDEAK
jgi:hypothetical protein